MAGARREIPLRYSDNFRGAFTYTLLPVVIIGAWLGGALGSDDTISFLMLLCGIATVGSIAYLVWTHLLFSRTPHATAVRIAAAQQRRRPGVLVRLLGDQQDAGTLSLSSATLTIAVAIASILVGVRSGGLVLPLLVLATAASSWATMVYAFALQYFRLHSGGERFEFDIDEAPIFTDFVSMSVMVSSVGALSAGTPKTRAGLNAVRTHTYIAFIFNALVVAMTVSILGSLISRIG